MLTAKTSCARCNSHFLSSEGFEDQTAGGPPGGDPVGFGGFQVGGASISQRAPEGGRRWVGVAPCQRQDELIVEPGINGSASLGPKTGGGGAGGQCGRRPCGKRHTWSRTSGPSACVYLTTDTPDLYIFLYSKFISTLFH